MFMYIYIYTGSKSVFIVDKLHVCCLLLQFWIDEYLRWDPKDYGGTESVVVSRNMLWTPPLALENR